MKGIKMKNLVLSLVLFLLAAGLSNSQPRREEGKIKHRNLIEKLNLTDAQKVKFESLRLNHQKEMIDLKADLEKARLALRELRAKGNFSRSGYLDAVEKVNGAENKISLSKANHRMDIYDMLTDEQKKIFSETGLDFGGSDVRGRLHKKLRDKECLRN